MPPRATNKSHSLTNLQDDQWILKTIMLSTKTTPSTAKLVQSHLWFQSPRNQRNLKFKNMTLRLTWHASNSTNNLITAISNIYREKKKTKKNRDYSIKIEKWWIITKATMLIHSSQRVLRVAIPKSSIGKQVKLTQEKVQLDIQK
jgi:hypothetical protein